MLRRLTRLGGGAGRTAVERTQRAIAAQDYAAAAQYATEAFERLREDDGASWLHLGDLETMLDRLESAERAYLKASECSDVRTTSLSRLAGLYLQQGAGAQAADAADAALAERPGDPMLRWVHALAIEKTRGPADALDLLLDLAHDAPTFAHAFRDVGRLSALTGDTYACIEAWRRVVELAPEDLEAHTALGIALSEAGEHDYGIEVLERVVQRRDDHAPYYANLGLALLRGDRAVDALDVLERAIAQWPDDPQVLVNLGVALDTLGQAARAVSTLRRATELAPDFANAYFNLGHALSAQGEMSEAARAFARAHDLAPDDPEILAAVPRQDMEDSLTGSLSTLTLDALVELIRARRVSGRLLLVAPTGEASALHLIEGRISSAHASPFDLVERVVRAKLAPPNFLDRLGDDIDPHRHPERLGVALVQQLGVDPTAWRRVLAQHTESSLARMLDQRQGRFTLVHESFPSRGIDADARDLVAKIRAAQSNEI